MIVLVSQRLFTPRGERDHAVLFPFPIPDHDLVPVEVDVFDSQPTSFEQSHSRTIVQFHQQADGTSFRTLLKNSPDFFNRQDRRKSFRLLRTNGVDIADVDFKNVFEEEKNCRECLILGAGRH